MMYIEIYFLMQLIILITLIVLYRKDYIALKLFILLLWFFLRFRIYS